MPAGAKGNQLVAIAHVGFALEVLSLQASNVNQHFLRGRFAGERRECRARLCF